MDDLSIFDKGVMSIEQELLPIRETFSYINKGDNVLFEVDDTIYLLKYEGSEAGAVSALHDRVNRYINLVCVGNFFLPKEERDRNPYTHKDPSKRIVEKARIDVFGTHKIKFERDEEFGIYLPSSGTHSDIYLTVALRYADGRIEKTVDSVDITVGDSLVSEKLKKITRPKYFERIIIPFLEGRPTDLRVPRNKGNIERLVSFFRSFGKKYKRPLYREFDMIEAYEWLHEATKDLQHGDFVYIGCKEEVYLMGIAKNDDGTPYMPRRYSTKPIFFFSNNYLGYTSVFDTEKDVPGFNGEPFIFTAMGRKQDYKNSLFTGEPDIITGDIDEALEHFETTDFAEFEDIVKKYYERIREPNTQLPDPGCY